MRDSSTKNNAAILRKVDFRRRPETIYKLKQKKTVAPSLRIILRIFCCLLFLTLVAFALLQLNDPDPILWTGFYLIGSLVPLLLSVNKYISSVFWLALLCSVIVMGIYAEGALEYWMQSRSEALMQPMHDDKPYIEEAREFIGGLITFCFLLICQGVRKLLFHRD